MWRAFLLCLVLVHFRKLHLPPQDPASPSPSHSNGPEMAVGACTSLTTLDHFSPNKLSSFLVMPTENIGIADQDQKEHHVSGGLGRTATDWVVLHGTGNLCHTLPPATYWLLKADTMKFWGVSNPHGLFQQLSSAPRSGPNGDRGSSNCLPQGLGSDMGQGQEVVECVG